MLVVVWELLGFDMYACDLRRPWLTGLGINLREQVRFGAMSCSSTVAFWQIWKPRNAKIFFSYHVNSDPVMSSYAGY